MRRATCCDGPPAVAGVCTQTPVNSQWRRPTAIRSTVVLVASYFGEPYTHDDRHGLSPAAQPTGGVHAQ